jgi:hypothetical protein
MASITLVPERMQIQFTPTGFQTIPRFAADILSFQRLQMTIFVRLNYSAHSEEADAFNWPQKVFILFKPGS